MPSVFCSGATTGIVVGGALEIARFATATVAMMVCIAVMLSDDVGSSYETPVAANPALP